MKHSVDVWQIALGGGTLEEQQCSEKLLSPEERLRARRFQNDRERNRFIQRQAGLRRILASVTGQDAARLEFGATPHGKPTLRNGPHDLFFNVSHSRDLALCVVSRGEPVGIDLEGMDPALEVLAVAREHFSASEYAMLCGAPASRRHLLFYKFWTAGEAYLKGIGCGLSLPLRELELSWDKTEHTIQTICCRAHDGAPWQVVELPLAPPFLATLATPESVIVSLHALPCFA